MRVWLQIACHCSTVRVRTLTQQRQPSLRCTSATRASPCAVLWCVYAAARVRRARRTATPGMQRARSHALSTICLSSNRQRPNRGRGSSNAREPVGHARGTRRKTGSRTCCFATAAMTRGFFGVDGGGSAEDERARSTDCERRARGARADGTGRTPCGGDGTTRRSTRVPRGKSCAGAGRAGQKPRTHYATPTTSPRSPRRYRQLTRPQSSTPPRT